MRYRSLGFTGITNRGVVTEEGARVSLAAIERSSQERGCAYICGAACPFAYRKNIALKRLVQHVASPGSIENNPVHRGIHVAVRIDNTGLQRHWLSGLRIEHGSDLIAVQQGFGKCIQRLRFGQLVYKRQRDLLRNVQLRISPVRRKMVPILRPAWIQSACIEFVCGGIDGMRVGVICIYRNPVAHALGEARGGSMINTISIGLPPSDALGAECVGEGMDLLGHNICAYRLAVYGLQFGRHRSIRGEKLRIRRQSAIHFCECCGRTCLLVHILPHLKGCSI
jgi:hypothetical protein